jgi:hypothetical protein
LLSLTNNAFDTMNSGSIRVVSTVDDSPSNSPLVSSAKVVEISVVDEGDVSVTDQCLCRNIRIK